MTDNIAGALIGAIVGNLIVLTWALWPVIADIARHGARNDR